VPSNPEAAVGRPGGRAVDALREIRLERGAAANAEGSCLIAFGATKVLCAVSVEDGVPGWKKGRGEGWLTAEYAMLPRATHTRTARERGQVGGRTQEIQRLIGRSVRAMLDDFRWGEFTLKVDCDVLQADGGTRTAATGRIGASPVKRRVAAVSVGVVGGTPVLDLEYAEDVRADVDANVVMSSEGRFVEVQGTGEQGTFARAELDRLLDLAAFGIARLDRAQRDALGIA